MTLIRPSPSPETSHLLWFFRSYTSDELAGIVVWRRKDRDVGPACSQSRPRAHKNRSSPSTRSPRPASSGGDDTSACRESVDEARGSPSGCSSGDINCTITGVSSFRPTCSSTFLKPGLCDRQEPGTLEVILPAVGAERLSVSSWPVGRRQDVTPNLLRSLRVSPWRTRLRAHAVITCSPRLCSLLFTWRTARAHFLGFRPFLLDALVPLATRTGGWR